MPPRVVDRDQKKQNLIEAAARVFARQGFPTTRVADIADEAGVGKGTLYEYFDSKEEIFFAVFEWFDERIRERVAAELARHASARDQLVALCRLGAVIVSEQRDIYPMTFDFWSLSRGGEPEVRFSESCEVQYDSYRRLVADIIRRGQASGEFLADVEADGVATMLVATFDGLGMQHWLDASVDPVASSNAFIEALCRGLCRSDAS